MADEGPLAGPSAEPPDRLAVAEQSVQRLRDRTTVDPMSAYDLIWRGAYDLTS